MTTGTPDIYGTDTVSKYSDLAVSAHFTRFLFKCKNKECKHVWAREYRKVYSVMPETIWPRQGGKPYRVEAVYEYQRFADGRLTRYAEDCNCPLCGRRGEANAVVGVLNEQHKCDARCMGAKNGACECSCGGKNHGINHL